MVKRLFLLLTLLTTSIVINTSTALALEFPEPVGFINDFANILSPDTRQVLEQRLAQLEKESSIEIAVVTVKSLEGTTIEDYAVRLFENWKIGKEDQDNGILLLVAPNERALRIEVGYGLEPVLTDAKAGKIIRHLIKPEFQKNDYDRGILKGVEAISKITRGEGVNLDLVNRQNQEDEGGAFWILLFTGFIFLSYLASFLARSKRYWPGGVIGAFLGVVLGIVLASVRVGFLAALGLGLLGLLFDYLLSKNYKERRRHGLPTSWWSSGGGFFSGGSGGGGFGGFGGGRSGGGGASGSW